MARAAAASGGSPCGLDLERPAGVAHPVRGELAVLPQHERCEPLWIPGAVRFLTSGTSFWRSSTTKSRIRSQPARAASGFASGGGSSLPHRLQRGDRADLLRRLRQRGPDRRQVLRADPGLRGDVGQGRVRLAQGRAVLEAPGGQEVVGVVGRLPLVEVDDAADAVLVAVGVGDRPGAARRRTRPASARGGRRPAGPPPGTSSAAPATWPATRPSCRSRPRWPGSTGNSLRRPDVHAGQVADGVVVLGVAQPPGGHRAGVAGVPLRLVLAARPGPRRRPPGAARPSGAASPSPAASPRPGWSRTASQRRWSLATASTVGYASRSRSPPASPCRGTRCSRS